ncbi:undecaprenyldiphospho-muramoylpentapeptide beta-N-acetylglucosaminyltransferase [Oerskovia turbata]|uniref:UDP-N-acetylglucosamine--N-acetylmuramyl-(pentapeptide) pyrophosphoryl-undecaprenol N-acetylglucosamine transferase n=1 Tax=Oerskovia turbata TaxID=1713 RepID=A0A4Q1L0Y0_9CELL|nr:undecaprenyldiphospho-muramoylpentapeptide beta-N-acetylglucosaminyltransferase [Oerskovia turbata]RXR27802.1 undecaprenyldiphospho-muramoylpentapeptide beta-N-acetylglucosaminyltransferase [Oerskovia turbata]RXR35760.1 undecaprenyldiphospho-muramoylpentapeptide beta-N-acetylglucosaminyltransferase [Oerskovia turbata]
MVSSSVGSVVLAGGGTAGHVNPLLAVADELRARNPEAVLTVLGTESGLEADLVPARGYPLRFVPKVPMPRRPSGEWVALPGRLKAAVEAAGAVIDETRAEVVVGFGGYVSTPAYIAAHRRGVPIVIHEQNARPGLANRAGARWAMSVALTFEGTPLKGGVVTGLPLRWEIADLIRDRGVDAPTVRANAAAALGLDPARPTVVVTGGSLGAQSLNEAVSGAAREILATGAQVLHLTGRGKADAVRAAVAGLGGYDVREYLAEMHLAYAVADLVVCRSGAGTVSELAALGIPAVYVPLPVGNGEQRLNAGPLVRAGGGVLVEDEAFTAPWVAVNVPALVTDGDRLRTMASLASRAGVQDATARVADLVVKAAGGSR